MFRKEADSSSATCCGVPECAENELQLTFRVINNALENLLTGIIHIELIRKQF